MSRNLFPHQKSVLDHLLSGENVILQAPTGSGKTLGAIYPFIYAMLYKAPEDFPRKCIYSTPMRVLANQFLKEFHTLADEKGLSDSLQVTIQTGEFSEDHQLEGDLIFSTIDQTLSSFLNIPYALSKSQGNLNAGAILSSYLVFDEFHLFDPDVMLPTVLQMLKFCRGLTPFVIMTATFSSSLLARLGEILNAAIIPASEAERQQMLLMPSQMEKERIYNLIDSELHAGAVLNSLRPGQRVICVCNTVRSAQRLYQELLDQVDSEVISAENLELLHARFYPSDRARKEAWIQAHFGSSQLVYDGPSRILVATQVIEVGLDITCDVMHTELAPAASLLQRGGRCARRTGETGRVFVYLPRTENGELNFSPYHRPGKDDDSSRGAVLCKNTLAALSGQSFTGRHLDFVLEQALIDQVHSQVDSEILDAIDAIESTTRSVIFRTIANLDPAGAGQLIRTRENIFTIVHPEPEKDAQLEHSLWAYEGFSLTRGSLYRAFKQAEENIELSWLMKFPIQLDQDIEGPQASQPIYDWQALAAPGEIYTSSVLALNPQLAEYSPELGLRFMINDRMAILPPLRQTGAQYRRFTYQKETYEEHILRMIRVYEHPFFDQENNCYRKALKDEVAHLFQRLDQTGLDRDLLDLAVRLMLAAHDLGKLTRDWQKWAADWQALAAAAPAGEQDLLAHTDYDGSDRQRELQRSLPKRPPHAASSAMMTWGVVKNHIPCIPLAKALLTAVLRHHSAGAFRAQAYQAHQNAGKHFSLALGAAGLPEDWINDIQHWKGDGNEPITNALVSFTGDHIREAQLYFLLVRLLRLADQRSQKLIRR